MCCLCVCLSEEEEIHRKFAHGLALFDFKKKTVVYNILYVLISVKTYAGVNDLFSNAGLTTRLYFDTARCTRSSNSDTGNAD